eukprot:c24031_g6_i3 orf=390-1436(+)
MMTSSISMLACAMDKSGSLDKHLQTLEISHQQGAPISRESVYYLLQEYMKKKDLIAGRRIQALMSRQRLDSIAFLGNHLIRLFAACGSFQEAIEAFHRVVKPTVYTWNALISAHLQFGDNERVFGLYQEMQETSVKRDTVTCLYMLKACSVVGAIGQGWLIHDHILRDSVEDDVALGNTLIDMYAKCGVLAKAQGVFDKLPDCDDISWNVLITGYAQYGHGEQALNCLEQMQLQGFCPDEVTFIGTLKACATIGAVHKCQGLHAQIVKVGLDAKDIVVMNALIDAYVKCGLLAEAQEVFDRLSVKDVVSWTALMAGYSDHGQEEEALSCYEQMQAQGIPPNAVTFVCS